MFTSDSFKQDVRSNNTNIVPIVVLEKKIIIEDEELREYYGFSTNNLEINTSEESIYCKPILLGLPKLKESIDIESSKYKISSVTLNFSNVEYNGSRMSDLFTNSMLINETVSIYFKSQSCTTLTTNFQKMVNGQEDLDTDCPLLYVGKIRQISHTDEKLTIKLEDLTEQKIHRDLPQEYLGDADNVPNRYKNKPIPMLYGRLNNAPTVARYEDGRYSIIADYKSIQRIETEEYYSGFYYDDDNEPIDEKWDIGGLKLYKGGYLSVLHEIKHQFVKNEFLSVDDPDDEPEINTEYVPLSIGQRQISFSDINNNTIYIENGGLFSKDRLQALQSSIPKNVSFKRLNDNGYSGQQPQEYIGVNELGEIQNGNGYTISANSSNVGNIGENLGNPYTNQDILFGYRLSATYGVNGGKYNKLLKFKLNDYNLPVKDIDTNISTSFDWSNEIPHLFSGTDIITSNPDGYIFLYGFNDSFFELTDTEETEYSDWGINMIPQEWLRRLTTQYSRNNGSVSSPFSLAPNSSEFPSTQTSFDDDDYLGLTIGYTYAFDPDRTIKFITSADELINGTSQGNCFPVLRYHEGQKSYQDDKSDSLTYNIDFLKLYLLNAQQYENVQSNVCDSKIELTIENIHQDTIVDVENVSDEEFYVDVLGRVDDDISNEYLKNPIHVMRHILKEECGVVDFDEDEYDVAVEQHSDYKFAFAVKDKINSKKLLEEISENTQSYPRLKNNGKFGFVTLKRNYEQEDYQSALLIDNKDIIKYDFKLTDVNNLISSIHVDYNYDFASNSYLKRYANTPDMTAQALEFYGIEDASDNKVTIEAKYTNDLSTAYLMSDRKFYNNSAQHLIINMQLPLRYSEVEVGTIIKFEKDRLIDGIKAYGMDYTNPIAHGKSYRYPLFLITEVQRSLESITISCYQLHKILSVDVWAENHEFWNEDNFPNINLEDPADELDVLEDTDVDVEDFTEMPELNFLIGADSEFSTGGDLFPSAYERHFRFTGTNNNYNLKFEHFHALANFNLSDWNDLVPSGSVLAGNGGFDSGFDRKGGFVAIDIRMTPKNPNDNDYYILSLRNVAQTAFDVDNYFGWDVETFEIPERFLTYAQGGEHMNNDTKQGNRASTNQLRLGWVLINSNPAWDYVSCYNHGMTGVSNNIDFLYNESYYGEVNVGGQDKDFTYSMVLYPHFVPDETRQLTFSTFLNAQMSSNVDFINSEWNVLDVVLLIQFILFADGTAIDVNADGEVNVLDVVLLVEIILGNV